jgi:hypothetical protein
MTSCCQEHRRIRELLLSLPFSARSRNRGAHQRTSRRCLLSKLEPASTCQYEFGKAYRRVSMTSCCSRCGRRRRKAAARAQGADQGTARMSSPAQSYQEYQTALCPHPLVLIMLVPWSVWPCVSRGWPPPRQRILQPLARLHSNMLAKAIRSAEMMRSTSICCRKCSAVRCVKGLWGWLRGGPPSQQPAPQTPGSPTFCTPRC